MSSVLEDAKETPLNRFGDDAHQSKLTRSILVKLDTRYVSLAPALIPAPILCDCDRTNQELRIN